MGWATGLSHFSFLPQTEIFLGIFLHHAWKYLRIIIFSYTIEIYDIS